MSNDDTRNVAWLLLRWREDLGANKHVFAPGFHAIAVHRFGVWSQKQEHPAQWILNKAYTLAYLFVRTFYGIELPRDAIIGRRLKLPHPVGVVVAHRVQVGDDCLIRQNVTLGNTGTERTSPQVPKLGNGVHLGAGAVILGGVTIGDDARIGPNSVVVTDVPPGGSAFTRSASLIQVDDTNHTLSEDVKEIGFAGVDGGLKVDEFIALIHKVIGPDDSIDSDTPIISTGIIDSFDVVALLTAVEDRYGVDMKPEEIDVESFDTPRQMLNYIHERQET